MRNSAEQLKGFGENSSFPPLPAFLIQRDSTAPSVKVGGGLVTWVSVLDSYHFNKFRQETRAAVAFLSGLGFTETVFLLKTWVMNCILAGKSGY